MCCCPSSQEQESRVATSVGTSMSTSTGAVRVHRCVTEAPRATLAPKSGSAATIASVMSTMTSTVPSSWNTAHLRCLVHGGQSLHEARVLDQGGELNAGGPRSGHDEGGRVVVVVARWSGVARTTQQVEQLGRGRLAHIDGESRLLGDELRGHLGPRRAAGGEVLGMAHVDAGVGMNELQRRIVTGGAVVHLARPGVEPQRDPPVDHLAVGVERHPLLSQDVVPSCGGSRE